MAETSAPPAGPAPPSALSAVTEAAESDSVSADTLSDSASMGGSSEVGSSIGSAVSSLAGEADADDVIAFAKYLGMDPAADRDLLWIAHQALNATLPSEWTEHEECAPFPRPLPHALGAPSTTDPRRPPCAQLRRQPVLLQRHHQAELVGAPAGRLLPQAVRAAQEAAGGGGG